MKVFPIDNIPEFSKKERIVVVGVIGKSSFQYPNKAAPLLSSVNYQEKGIECQWDERAGVLYLHAVTDMDTRHLVTLADNLSDQSPTTDKEADAAHWLVAAGELAAEAGRRVALLFHLCHIVVLASPAAAFDLGYLQLFKAIDAYRAEMSGAWTAALGASGVGGAWAAHGRACCPRVLFLFARAPAALHARPRARKRLEHALEDQLYFILRKARVITNVCAKSLFAIPKNEEFVYMCGEGEAGGARDAAALARGLAARCGAGGGAPAGGGAAAGGGGRSFRRFLRAHVELAFRDGFDDNVGKYAMTTSFFELPSAATWRAAAGALLAASAPAPSAAAAPSAADAALYNALATDVRFSQARCAKVVPLAQAAYSEGLPAHYSARHHALKLSAALGVVRAQGRGPLAAGAAARLRAACEAVWAARRLCEAPSLTGRPCVLPHHDSSVAHSSGAVFVCACDCGRTRLARDDPYSVRRANHGFYARAARACCRALPARAFPAFAPSTPAPRAAEVSGGAEGEEEEEDADSEAEGEPAGAAAGAGSEGGSSPAWGPPSPRASPSPPSPAADAAPPPPEPAPAAAGAGAATAAGATGAVMTRQASTTEYLPGMLHERSPPGLLPAYPAWALTCLGPSSLYSHALGLPEALQPGLLPHTNFLVPWDAPAPPAAARAARAARPKPPAHHPTVKIFLGFEYECPRGHRLMMSSPDTVVSGGAGGGGGGAAGVGAALAGSDMPLSAACLCRGPAPAHLARVHVVTPKAPVSVTLTPRAQPVAGGPVFVPQPAELGPIKLTPSAYWVLRLPFVYCSERGPLPRPRPAPPHAGRLLAPLVGLVE